MAYSYNAIIPREWGPIYVQHRGSEENNFAVLDCITTAVVGT